MRNVGAGRLVDLSTRATMCRLKPSSPGHDSISIPREIFDELLEVVDLSIPAQSRFTYELSVRQEGDLVMIAVQSSVGAYSVTAPTLLEGLLDVRRRFDQLVEERIR